MRGVLAGTQETPRFVPVVFALVAIAILIVRLIPLLGTGPTVNGYLAVDYDLYMDATRRWMAGGEFYQPYQLVGPYPITPGDILYPPVVLWLFVPFTVLPAALWWFVPLGLTVWVIWRLRPGFVVWPLLALCVVWPPTTVKVVTGNPVIWAMTAMALGVVYLGAAVFVLIKPSLAPFAFFGAWSRRWWIVLAVFAVMCIPFGSMWSAWLTTVVNSQGGGLAYSVQEIPMLALPLIAWVARRRPVPSGASV